MAKLTNKWIFFLVNLILSAVFYFLLSWDNSFLLGYINVLFYMAFFYFFITLSMFVLKGKFLDGVVYGSRRFLSRISPTRDYLDEWEDYKLPSETVENSFIRIFLWQGMMLGTVMVILLFVYYY